MVHFSPNIEQQKHFILMIWVWHGVAIISEQIAYRCLLTNCLHDKAAELSLANS